MKILSLESSNHSNKQEDLDAQIKIVRQQAIQLKEMNDRVWGDFRSRILKNVPIQNRNKVIASWNL